MFTAASPAGFKRYRTHSRILAHTIRRGGTADPWVANMLARKPRMLVAVALANRMARVAWAMMRNKEAYRAHASA